MSFYDIVLDFILMDAFEDLENPPSSVLAVLRNRWLSDSFKETVGGAPLPHVHTPRPLAWTRLLRPWLWAPSWAPHHQTAVTPWAGSPPLGPGEASQGPRAVLCLSFRTVRSLICSSVLRSLLLPLLMRLTAEKGGNY